MVEHYKRFLQPKLTPLRPENEENTPQLIACVDLWEQTRERVWDMNVYEDYQVSTADTVVKTYAISFLEGQENEDDDLAAGR